MVIDLGHVDRRASRAWALLRISQDDCVIVDRENRSPIIIESDEDFEGAVDHMLDTGAGI